MSIFRQRFTIPAAGTIANLLAGSKFEFLSQPAVVSLWATDDGGASASELTFTLGNVVVADPMPVNTAAAAGNINTQQDMIGSGVGAGGDRIQILARNTDAGAAVNVTIMLQISEL